MPMPTPTPTPCPPLNGDLRLHRGRPPTRDSLGSRHDRRCYGFTSAPRALRRSGLITPTPRRRRRRTCTPRSRFHSTPRPRHVHRGPRPSTPTRAAPPSVCHAHLQGRPRHSADAPLACHAHMPFLSASFDASTPSTRGPRGPSYGGVSDIVLTDQSDSRTDAEPGTSP